MVTCNCVRCGKEFESNRKTAVCKECLHTAVCVVCGEPLKLKYPYTQKTCSAKCRGIYRKESGVSAEVSEKSKETKLERYGSDSGQIHKVFVKKCKYCGKEFQTYSTRQVYCEGLHYGSCPVCGKSVLLKERLIVHLADR